MIECLRRVVDASISVGGIGCAVDAKDADSKGFYEKFGFVAIDAVEGDSLALWLPFEQCLEAVELSLAGGEQ